MRADFYVNSRRPGHGFRTREVAKHLKETPYIITSQFDPEDWKGARIVEVVEIPKAPEPGAPPGGAREAEVPCFHHAPMPCPEMAERTFALTAQLLYHPPNLLVVDTSAEVTLQARLCGLATAVVRQHGLRDDPAHDMVYKSADLLLAPFPELLEDEKTPYYVHRRTRYTPGFSRFSGKKTKSKASARSSLELEDSATVVLVVTGRKGLPAGTEERLRAAFPTEALIFLRDEKSRPKASLHFAAADLIISSARHHSVMEVGHFKKPFIAVAEDRPFGEQARKVEVLEREGLATGVPGWDISVDEWKNARKATDGLDLAKWSKVVSATGAKQMARVINDYLGHKEELEEKSVL